MGKKGLLIQSSMSCSDQKSSNNQNENMINSNSVWIKTEAAELTFNSWFASRHWRINTQYNTIFGGKFKLQDK